MRPENKYFIPILLTGNSTSCPVGSFFLNLKKKWKRDTENDEMFDKHFQIREKQLLKITL